MKNKQKILEQTKNREIMIFLATDLNRVIVKRKIKDSFIRLDSSNYDKIISGRTLSIISTMNRYENFGIIDIDYHDFNVAKEATAKIYDYLYRINKNLKIFFTGKSSFHIRYGFDMKYPIDQIRLKLKDILQDLADKYNINYKRNKEQPNLDLSPNKYRGGFITPFSLSIKGLQCLPVLRNSLSTFKQVDAKIR